MRLLLLLLPLIFGTVFATTGGTEPGTGQITVTIDYGPVRPGRTVTVSYNNGMTALEVLKRAAEVRTKKAGAFTFITSIDGVRSTPQKMGWFYDVDGRHADKTASTLILHGAKTMRWEYRPDHCLGR